MKKIFAAILVILTLMTLVACSSNTLANTTDPDKDVVISTGDATTDRNQTEDEFDITKFPEAPAKENALKMYISEVSKRLNRYDADLDFVTDDERAYLAEQGYSIPGKGIGIVKYNTLYLEMSEYMFPVLFRDGSDVQLWYTNAQGNLYTTTISGSYNSDYYDCIHCNVDGENVYHITATESYTVCYEPATGKVTTWVLGEAVNCVMVPKNSVYTGLSYWEGYIFRSNTDIYAVKTYGAHNANADVSVIAHNVAMVLQADFKMGSDDWSQPLFLMKDGTVKGYCYWYGDRDSAPDDESHLKEVRYEGGYDHYKVIQ